jgi:hypothetical protein
MAENRAGRNAGGDRAHPLTGSLPVGITALIMIHLEDHEGQFAIDSGHQNTVNDDPQAHEEVSKDEALRACRENSELIRGSLTR